ncbi:MAG: DUF4334 domain-containing protein [Oscillospiraceae bacterium]|jgi:hypothetical protein|nr:DUF4334 domain-containing protein [Oscillospiraceae bacterium]
MEIEIKPEMSQEEAFSLFDSLAPVLPDTLPGVWKGAEIRTGHPMDGLLDATRWYGKDIQSGENVHPLLFTGITGRVFSGNPGMLPLEAFTPAPRCLVTILFTMISPFIHTSKGRARLRIQEYRGRNTAVMIYDQKPLIDAFARIDEDTILGVTDAKWAHDKGYFFTLQAAHTMER